MKIFLWAFLLSLLFLTACEGQEEASPIVYGTYTLPQSEVLLAPSISLADGGFVFMLSPLSSYLPIGSYQLDGDRLTLTSDSRNSVFVFLVEGQELVFVADESAAPPAYRMHSGSTELTPAFADGDRFVLQ